MKLSVGFGLVAILTLRVRGGGDDRAKGSTIIGGDGDGTSSSRGGGRRRRRGGGGGHGDQPGLSVAAPTEQDELFLEKWEQLLNFSLTKEPGRQRHMYNTQTPVSKRIPLSRKSPLKYDNCGVRVEMEEVGTTSLPKRSEIEGKRLKKLLDILPNHRHVWFVSKFADVQKAKNIADSIVIGKEPCKTRDLFWYDNFEKMFGSAAERTDGRAATSFVPFTLVEQAFESPNARQELYLYMMQCKGQPGVVLKIKKTMETGQPLYRLSIQKAHNGPCLLVRSRWTSHLWLLEEVKIEDDNVALNPDLHRHRLPEYLYRPVVVPEAVHAKWDQHYSDEVTNEGFNARCILFEGPVKVVNSKLKSVSQNNRTVGLSQPLVSSQNPGLKQHNVNYRFPFRESRELCGVAVKAAFRRGGEGSSSSWR